MEVKKFPAKSFMALIILTGSVNAANAAEENEFVSTIGLGYGSSMKYSGSDERTSSAVPYFNIQYGNYFLDSAEGLGFTLNWDNGLYFTQAFGYSSGRVDKNSDSRDGSKKLKGMGTIKESAVSSSTLGWEVGKGLVIEANLSAPITDSQGVAYRAGIKYRLWADDRDTLVFSTNANFGDARYNNTYYGVSREQSERSGFKKYKAGAGLYSLDASLSWTHAFNDNWWSYAEVDYTHLDKNVSKSDIVFRNSQTEYVVGVLYSF